MAPFRRGCDMQRRALAVLVAFICCACTFALPDPIPAGHGGRGTAEPGNEGPCGSDRHTVFNPAQWELPTYVYEPTGPGECAAPGRPVVFFGHGWLVSFPEAYAQLVTHLVSH